MTASVTGRGLPESKVDRWVYALKPASWPKLVVPALFGQLLGARAGERLDLAALGWGFGFTAFGLVFIVLLNDWGDREVDALKREMFPDGCSPKTIPDGILRSRAVGVAGLACGVVAASFAAGAEVSLGRDLAFEAGVVCMLVFVAYTLPPVRLNYRGGGEFLEMVGVGVALPLRCSLVVARLQVLFTLDLHRKLEELAKDPPQIGCSICDQMFQNSLNRRSVSQVHSLPP